MLQVGLAVGDIKAIQDEAELRSNLLQVGVYALNPMHEVHLYACIRMACICICLYMSVFIYLYAVLMLCILRIH